MPAVGDVDETEHGACHACAAGHRGEILAIEPEGKVMSHLRGARPPSVGTDEGLEFIAEGSLRVTVGSDESARAVL